MGIKIPISLYRHIVTWFMNHNCERFQAYLTMTGRLTLARQLGHGVDAHSLYASDSRIPSGIDFHNFFQTMLASAVWHDLLGFPPTLLDSMTSRHRGIAESGGSAQVNGTLVKHETGPDAKDIAAEVAKIIIPEFHRMHSQTRANDLASFLDTIGLDLQTPISHPLEQTTAHVTHPSRIDALRKFCRDNNATFNHQQQALAVELMASGNSSILLIGPTGK
jgi:hypothetical protein